MTKQKKKQKPKKWDTHFKKTSSIYFTLIISVMYNKIIDIKFALFGAIRLNSIETIWKHVQWKIAFVIRIQTNK